MSELLIQAENVSKKFCRSLKRSLWYGITDVLHSLNPWSPMQNNMPISPSALEKELRPDEFWVLKDLNFEVRRGECLGLIGHNGAGKSTLLKILNEVIRPDRGSITMRGRVGAMIELGAGFNPLLTGRENIYNQAALIGFTPQEVKRNFDTIVEFAELSHALDMPLQNYSSGMRIRLGFSIFAHLEPDILLIDEVLAVGDVGFRMKSLNKMSELISKCAVIFVTHSMPQVFRICNEVMLLSQGTAKYHGRDIGEGVAAYFREFQGGQQTVTGSGESEVLKLTASCDSRSAKLHQEITVRHGESLRIETLIRLTGNFKSAKIQFLFWNIELLPIMDVMTEQLDGFCFESDTEGTARISAVINNLPLNSGTYNVSVIILSEDLKTLCRHDNALQVTVIAKCHSGAGIIHSAIWETHKDKSLSSSSA